MKNFNKILVLLVSVMMVILGISGISFAAEASSNDVVVIYTGDVNGNADGNLEYASLVAYSNEMTTAGKRVEIVDLGNSISGTVLATITKGAFSVDAMNIAKYSFAVPGVCEFDYGVNSFLNDISQEADYEYISSNFISIEKGNTVFAPYKIKDYNGIKIAYLGISDPKLMSRSQSSFNGTTGRVAYSFFGDTDVQSLYRIIQGTIDLAKSQGADYIVALGNASASNEKEFTAQGILQNTSGINVFLNANGGQTIVGEKVKTKNGEYALLSSPGANMQSFGVLTISPSKAISSQIISSYSYRDINTRNQINSLKTELSTALKEAFAVTGNKLTVVDSKGVREVENEETNLGDLCADAYRIVTGADIGFVEASELKADVPLGKISYNDIVKAVPANDKISVVSVSGFDLLDALEMASRLFPNRNSNFLQVSGITFDIQETVLPSVSVDALGNFRSVDDDYRVTNVMVNGKELDLLGSYNVAATNNLLNGNTGFTMFKGAPLVKANVTTDNQAIISYILQNLKGTIGGAYSKSQGRIDSIKLARQSEIDRLVEEKVNKKISDYSQQIKELQEQITIQEEVIDIKSLTVTATAKFSKVSGKRKVKVTWKISDDIEGLKYQVYKSSKKSSGYKKAKSTSSKSYTNTAGLSKGNTYYYKVRGYKYLNGKYYYSNWSNIESVKVTK